MNGKFIPKKIELNISKVPLNSNNFFFLYFIKKKNGFEVLNLLNMLNITLEPYESRLDYLRIDLNI